MAATYFPQFANAVMTQLPYTVSHEFNSNVVDMECGQRWAFAFRGAGLTGFPDKPLGKYTLNLPSLTDADLATLKTFFIQCDGRLQEFIYLDPNGNLVLASELYSDASWEKNSVTVGAAYADPFGGNRATVLSASSANSNIVSTVLPDGFASGLVVTGSVWANAAALGQSLMIGFVDSSFTVLDYQIFSVPKDGWTRISKTITIATSAYIRLIIGGFGTWNMSTFRLFGAQVVPTAGPGGYAHTPGLSGYRPHTRFDTDELSWKKMGPNQNSVTVPLQEFWV